MFYVENRSGVNQIWIKSNHIFIKVTNLFKHSSISVYVWQTYLIVKDKEKIIVKFYMHNKRMKKKVITATLVLLFLVLVELKNEFNDSSTLLVVHYKVTNLSIGILNESKYNLYEIL